LKIGYLNASWYYELFIIKELFTMTTLSSAQDIWKQMAGEAAAQLVENGMLVGLGTGSTAKAFIRALGERIKAGLQVIGAVASSQDSADLATSLGIPMTTLDLHPKLDLYIDGADEINSQLQLIKGGGGALLREKIVATASRRFVVITDITKKVQRLNLGFPLPIEVIPFAIKPVTLQLQKLCATVQLRQRAGQTFMTENQNIILDCSFPGGIADPIALDAQLHQIVGVVETGLFLGLAQQALIAGTDGLEVLP
jgi:ribose 5-phosphate isomerase A